jgi:hypothetical protein
MLEYGNGVGQGAGNAGGGSGAGGQSLDVGASMSQFVTDSVTTLSAMPPAALLAGLVVILVGLMLLKKAF